jgi:hypothetical protein
MKKILFIASLLLLNGCAMYWTKPGNNLKQVSKDLLDCRLQANQGGEKIYQPMEIEGPCMTAKGYMLSYTPPPET